MYASRDCRALKGFTAKGGRGRIFGGPFNAVHKSAGFEDITVKLDPRNKLDHSIDLPVPDFKLPPSDAKVMATVFRVSRALSQGKDVYVGCTAGLGRTGTFLGVLVASANPDIIDPVAYVRGYYDPLAIETEAQERYVREWRSKHPWFAKALGFLYYYG